MDEALTKELPAVSHSYKRATMDLLSEGLNKGIAVTGKVLFFAKNESLAPL